MSRSILLALSLATLIAFPASAQKWAKEMFETTSHDFGKIAKGAKAEYEFVVTNIYMGNVHIASARPSCGCTSVKVKNPSLTTYEKGAVVASINSRTFLRRQGATITVTFDKPAPAKVQLQVKVYIQPDIVVEPSAVDFGSSEPGVAAERTVSVSSTRGSTWRILEVNCDNPYLSGEALEKSRQGERASYEIRVKLVEGAPVGYLADRLVLVTSDQHNKHIPVMIHGRVLSPVTVNPDALFLGVVESGQTVKKNLVVRAKKPFRVVAVGADCDCFEFGTVAEAPTRPIHILPITFTAGEKLGRVARTIRIETDVEECDVIELPAYAVVTQT